MSRAFACLLTGLALFLSSGKAWAQLSYEGYEDIESEVTFVEASQRDGELQLLIKIRGDQGRREWFKPDSSLLGCRIALPEDRAKQAIVLWPFARGSAPLLFPKGLERQLHSARGLFAFANRGNELIRACVGDTVSLGGMETTILRLNESEAEVRIAGRETSEILPITPAGALFSQQLRAEKQARSNENELRLLYYSMNGEMQARGVWGWIAFILLFAYFLIFTFIAFGLLTLEEPRQRRAVRKPPGGCR